MSELARTVSDYNPPPRPPDPSKLRWADSWLPGRAWGTAIVVFALLAVLAAVAYFAFESTWTDRECEEVANRRVTNQEQADRRWDELMEMDCPAPDP